MWRQSFLFNLKQLQLLFLLFCKICFVPCFLLMFYNCNNLTSIKCFAFVWNILLLLCYKLHDFENSFFYSHFFCVSEKLPLIGIATYIDLHGLHEGFPIVFVTIFYQITYCSFSVVNFYFISEHCLCLCNPQIIKKMIGDTYNLQMRERLSGRMITLRACDTDIFWYLIGQVMKIKGAHS